MESHKVLHNFVFSDKNACNAFLLIHFYLYFAYALLFPPYSYKKIPIC